MIKYIAIAILVTLIVSIRKFRAKREATEYKRAVFERNEREARLASENWMKASAQDTRTVRIRRGFDAPDYGSYMSGKK